MGCKYVRRTDLMVLLNALRRYRLDSSSNTYDSSGPSEASKTVVSGKLHISFVGVNEFRGQPSQIFTVTTTHSIIRLLGTDGKTFQCSSTRRPQRSRRFYSRARTLLMIRLQTSGLAVYLPLSYHPCFPLMNQYVALISAISHY